jgi:hypothetical protein
MHGESEGGVKFSQATLPKKNVDLYGKVDFAC